MPDERGLNPPGFGPARTILVILIAAGLGLMVVTLSAGTPMWLAMVLVAMLVAATMFWSGDLKRFLLTGMIVTSPISITKSLIVHKGVYSPAFELCPADLFIVALLLVWVFERQVLQRRPLRIGPGRVVLWAYFIGTWISAFLGSDPISGVLAATSLTKNFVLFILVADLVDSAADVRRVLGAGAIGMAINVAMVGAQFLTHKSLALQGSKAATAGIEMIYEGTGVSALRPFGFLLHPNVLADYLVLLLPLLMLLVLLGAARVGRRVWWPALLLFVGAFLALLLTLSRGGWISFGVAAVFLLAIGYGKRLVRKSQIVAIMTAIVIGLAAIGAAYPALYYRVSRGDNLSTHARFLMMDQAWLIIRQHPVLGVGLGQYNQAAQRNIPTSFASVSKEYQSRLLLGVVHQHYLLVWAECGLLGLLLNLLVFAVYVRQYFSVRQWPDPMLHAISLGLVAGLIGQLSFYNFDHFYIDVTRYVSWGMLGLLAAIFRIGDRSLRAAAVPRLS